MITTFSLTKVEGSGGPDYARIAPRASGFLDAEAIKRVKAMRDSYDLRAVASRIPQIAGDGQLDDLDELDD